MATSKADEYRAKAREAEQLAEKTTDSVVKAQNCGTVAVHGRFRRKVWATLGQPPLRSAPSARAACRRRHQNWVADQGNVRGEAPTMEVRPELNSRYQLARKPPPYRDVTT
jgi:hypothetical protein